jgi:hypothetical protein
LGKKKLITGDVEAEMLPIPEWMLKFQTTAKWSYWVQRGIIIQKNGKYYLQ